MYTPVDYSFENLYNSQYNPSQVHTQNTGLFLYYGNYLFKKILSVFKFEGLPETWAENYFKAILFGRGYIAVFDDPAYGVICQNCSLSDTISLFRQPTRVLIANPFFKKSFQLRVGKTCEILKVQPDYHGVLDIVSFYADMLAVSAETVGVNLMNSKVSFVFFAQNRQMAESFSKMYDQISSGKPFTVVDKSLQSEDGVKNWEMFEQNVGNNYVVTHVLNDMKTIEDQFNTKIGIPNANTQKRERLVTSEVESNDVDTSALVNVWLDTMQADLDRINRKYGLNISVKYRYQKYLEGDRKDDRLVD
jgi:hypothetical protein